MSEQMSIFSKIGNWFRSDAGAPSDYPGQDEAHRPAHEDHLEAPERHTAIAHVADARHAAGESRSTFLRPWAKRDAAIDNLQAGVGALTDLMNGIRDHLEKQGERQAEMLEYMSHLPQFLEKLPEGAKLQAETLRAIHQQMERQGEHQSKLSEILETITQADTRNGRTLDALETSVDALREHDEAISGSFKSVGAAMESVSKNSEASAAVLQQLRDNIDSRDGEMERILHRQGSRFTVLLSVALFLSIVALVVASVIGYLSYSALQHAR